MQSQPSTEHQLKKIDKHTRHIVILGQSSPEKPNLGKAAVLRVLLLSSFLEYNWGPNWLTLQRNQFGSNTSLRKQIFGKSAPRKYLQHLFEALRQPRTLYVNLLMLCTGSLTLCVTHVGRLALCAVIVGLCMAPSGSASASLPLRWSSDTISASLLCTHCPSLQL